jgi:hypothetical protein
VGCSELAANWFIAKLCPNYCICSITHTGNVSTINLYGLNNNHLFWFSPHLGMCTVGFSFYWIDLTCVRTSLINADQDPQKTELIKLIGFFVPPSFLELKEKKNELMSEKLTEIDQCK